MPYSLKMRASRNTLHGREHISGAERILTREELPLHASALLSRAMQHAKGEPDFVSMKVESISEEEISHLPALPVTTIEVRSAAEGHHRLISLLDKLGIKNGAAILARLQETYAMRGAMLLDAATMKRLEPDPKRGIRATYMDAARVCRMIPTDAKQHFKEALVLATKVANAPHIIAEICISDDPDYVTGYIASKTLGYVRITKLKETGSPDGGRIFLYDGAHEDVNETIAYLEKKCVLVHTPPRDMPTAPCPPAAQESGVASCSFRAYLQDTLEDKRKNHLLRTILPIDAAGTHVAAGDKQTLLFASNNYLGLAEDMRLKEAASRAALAYGAGTGGSRLTTGARSIHDALECALADFAGTEACLLFATGYMANVGTISALAGKDTVIFSDEKNHASIIDGCRLAKGETVIYRHNDMSDLEEKLRSHTACRTLIVTDSVFSMDGDIANLPQILDLARKYDALTMIDEAHATGVIGATGRGICEHFNLRQGPDIIMGTLSKALGSEGGYVCASRLIIDYLVNTARSFIFSTSQSPANILAAHCALDILCQNPELPARLHENIRIFSDVLHKNGIDTGGETAIFPILLGSSARTLRIADALAARGILVSAIRYPTVPKQQARLRIALSAAHTKDDLHLTANAIGETVRRIP